ncbi:MAG: hypothetical protein ACREJB_16085 [Planctomycetaceae bacterium]
MTRNALQTIERKIEQLTAGEKLRLIARLAQSLQPEATPLESDRENAAIARRQRALQQLRKDMAKLPVESPVDGFSNRDHDQLLYGGAT